MELKKKPILVRPSTDEHDIIKRAADKTFRSVSSFMLYCAMQEASKIVNA